MFLREVELIDRRASRRLTKTLYCPFFAEHASLPHQLLLKPLEPEETGFEPEKKTLHLKSGVVHF